MPDRLTDAIDRLDRVPVPMTWDDVAARVDGPEPLAPTMSVGEDGRRHRRDLLVAAVVLAVCAMTAALVRVSGNDEGSPVRTGPGSTTSDRQIIDDPATTDQPATTEKHNPTVPSAQTATTLPAISPYRGSAATVWTGSEYLVWGGQAGSDAHQRPDGWRYEPASRRTRDIPMAPIAPRDSAAGVWTGRELIVCCGRAAGAGDAYDTASAAAFDPATERWRALASPPADAAGYVIGSVWTGTEVLVVVQVGDPNFELAGHGIALLTYAPDEDRWARRAEPPAADRFGHVTWTGDRLVMLTANGAVSSYDPGADAWTRLPAFGSDHVPAEGSLAWVDGQLVVWGSDATDQTATVGYRLRPGEPAWRPLASAPIPSIDIYEGVIGSQSTMVDQARGRLLVLPVHGYERGGGGTGTEPPRLLSYDPSSDGWRELDTPPIGGFSPDLTLGDDVVLTPDQEHPEVTRLTD